MVYRLRRYVTAFRRYGAANKAGVGKISSFLSLTVKISKTVVDTTKVTIND